MRGSRRTWSATRASVLPRPCIAECAFAPGLLRPLTRISVGDSCGGDEGSYAPAGCVIRHIDGTARTRCWSRRDAFGVNAPHQGKPCTADLVSPSKRKKSTSFTAPPRHTGCTRQEEEMHPSMCPIHAVVSQRYMCQMKVVCTTEAAQLMHAVRPHWPRARSGP